MFGLLAQKKNGELDTQIEALNNQHNHGRNMISEMSSSLNGYAEGKNIQTEALMESISQYASLLRRHMHAEDYFFYPMAEEVLTNEEMQALEGELEKEDSKTDGSLMDTGRILVSQMGALLLRNN